MTRSVLVSVPIRSIGPAHQGRMVEHLLALNPADRYLRFGYSAGDAQIKRYIDGLNFERDDLLGIFNRKLELLAMAHLGYAAQPDQSSCAEFGVSVLDKARGRGYGQRLFDRATLHARNQGVELLFIHALSENTPMLNIARKAGAVLVRDGSETEAFLQLHQADFDSLVSEMVDEQWARTNYRLKVQAGHFRKWLGRLQSLRRGADTP